MKIKQAFSNKVLYIDREVHAEYHRGKIVFLNKDDEEISSIAINTGTAAKILSRNTWTERIFRLEPRYLSRVSSNKYIMSHNGRLYELDPEAGTMQKLFDYAKGTKNPLHFCSYTRNNTCEIVFGDYGGHDGMGNVGIYRLKNHAVTEISSIPGTTINHIHAVEYDKYRDCYWILTGDTDEGSGFWKVSYEGGEAEPFLLGKQKYRACFSFITEKEIFYATDTPLEENCLFKLDIESKRLTKLMDMPGSCIYGMRVPGRENTLCFATAVEPDSSLPRWRYLCTYKLGAGIKDRKSHIFYGDPDSGFTEVWACMKDRLPMVLFQFGNVRFPTQLIENKVYICPQACGKQDHTMELAPE